VHESFPEQFSRDTTDVGQLVFALKYDGVDLLALRTVFGAIGGAGLTEAVRGRPSSAYLRRLWFFYEFLMGQRLDLPDASTGAYVDALEPSEYITRPGAKLRRYRVNFNLLGASPAWCPIVRRTELLQGYEAKGLETLARAAVKSLSPRDLQRAIRYLYVKETRASFEIERATASDRMERFVEALFSHGAQRDGAVWWTERELVEVASIIINDPRFAPTGYRTQEVRVSEQRALSARERVHFVGARHVDVPSLMSGLVQAWQAHHLTELPRPVPGAIAGPNGEAFAFRRSCGVPFVDFVVAGCLSFGFVFIHPFDDANGRLHRLMLHRILSVTEFTPPGLVIPTSAAILHDLAGYDVALEDFSTRIMPFIRFSIDDADGSMTIANDTAHLYRYPDLTVQVEALCRWFESAVNTELVEELHTLRAIDDAKEAMRAIVELPDQRENLFLRICMQSFAAGRGYTLSKAKRTLFGELTDEEVNRLESAVRAAFQRSS
jgi:Fic/DOC family